VKGPALECEPAIGHTLTDEHAQPTATTLVLIPFMIGHDHAQCRTNEHRQAYVEKTEVNHVAFERAGQCMCNHSGGHDLHCEGKGELMCRQYVKIQSRGRKRPRRRVEGEGEEVGALALLPAHGRCAYEAPPDFVDLCTLACALFLLLPWFPTNTIQNHEEDFEIPATAAERRIIRRGHTHDDEAFHTHTQFAPFWFIDMMTSETSTLLSFEYTSVVSIGRPRCPIRDHERNWRRSSVCRWKQSLGHQPKRLAVTQRSVHHRSV
jgi:hypothetical protein